MRTEPGGTEFPLLIEDWLKAELLGCSICGKPAEASLFDLEVGEMPKGWVVVFTYRQVSQPDDGQVSIRWKPYCPAHAPTPSAKEARAFDL